MNKLDYTFNSTLEHMALFKIATVLWNQDDIRNCLTSKIYRFSKFSFGVDPIEERMSAWQKIENIVIGKVLRMLLPESVKEKVISCIKLTGLEILKWIANHVEVEYLAIRLPSEFCWTSHGTIDRKKTAVALIKDDKIEIEKRYKLACIYCLENNIKILKDEIPELPRITSFDFEPNDSYSELVHIWNCILKGNMAVLPDERNENTCTPFQYAFELVAEHGHEAATEYFFQKLTLAEREESLLRTVNNVILVRRYDEASKYGFAIEYHGDVLRFLLSQMDNQQLLKRHSLVLLECCLDWPWQGFLLETARYVQEFLDEYDYEDTLLHLNSKIKNGFKDYNYKKLFCELYQLIPKNHKKYFYVGPYGDIFLALPSTLLPSLFEIKEKENISLILKDATAVEKEKIIFCNQGKGICVELACNNERDLLEYFVIECITSQEKLIQFRKETTEYASRVEGKMTEEKKLCTISCFQLLDKLIQERK